MTINGIIVSCAGLCFASFAWAMIWHFGRLGKPSRALRATALLGVICGIVQIESLLSVHIRFPSTAIALYVCSAVLFWWAVRMTRGRLAACGQRCVSPAILENGPYRYVRHPFYLAYNLTWLAGFAATVWWPPAITAVVMAGMYERSIREEEQGFLRSGLAVAYQDYRRRVGKYLPRTGIARTAGR